MFIRESMSGTSGSTITHSAASMKPLTVTVGGAALAKASRLVSTPRPPAEQPARSTSAGPVEPRPWPLTRAVITAEMMRAPRKAKLKVVGEAGASPNQLRRRERRRSDKRQKGESALIRRVPSVRAVARTCRSSSTSRTPAGAEERRNGEL